MATLVYRVETAFGVGPYHLHPVTHLHIARRLRCQHPSVLARTPSPYFDSFDGEYPNHMTWDCFGFVDLKSLKRWFNAVDRKLLASAGCAIHVYEVDDLDWIGRSGQTYFRRDDAVHIDTLHLTKKGYAP